MTIELFVDHEKPAACSKIKKFQIEKPSTNKTLSINTWTEEVNPIVMEKIEHLEKSKLKTNWDFSQFRCKD